MRHRLIAVVALGLMGIRSALAQPLPHRTCTMMVMGVRAIAQERDMGVAVAKGTMCTFAFCDEGDKEERQARRAFAASVMEHIYKTPKLTPDQEVDWYLDTYCGGNAN